SMSAAVVSGAVALLLDGRDDLTPLQVKIALQASADYRSTDGLFVAGAGSLDLTDLDQLKTLTPATGNYATGYSVSVPNASGTTSQLIIWCDLIIWSDDLIIWSALSSF